VKFGVAVLGVLLAGITPNPPTSWLGWVQLVGASVATALATVLAARDTVRIRRPSFTKVPEWLREPRRRVLLAVGVVVAVVVALAAPTVGELLRGVWYRTVGCPPATQLRMVAEPETIATARELARAFERSAVADDHGCPTVRIFVFEATAASLAATLGSAEGWSTREALRDIGPQPDVWLASTGHEVRALQAGPAAGHVVDPVVVARSPLVLAVPRPSEEAAEPPDVEWPALFRDLTDRGQRVVRPDPAAGELGLLATALIYGQDGRAAGPALRPEEIERRIDDADVPTGDTADLLCRLRDTPQDAPGASHEAIITTEQEVARFNDGLPLGDSCGRAPEGAEYGRLVARYPTDTGEQDLQFVQLAWSDPVQERAAAAFRTWVRSADGGVVLVRSGLRPAEDPTFGTPLVAELGVDPTRPARPVPDDRWAAAAADYAEAQRPSRLLFLLDTSGSMTTVEPGGTRGAIAAAAVAAGLSRLNEDDEFGLWFFPGGTGSGYAEALRVGPRTDTRVGDAGTALRDVVPAGRTPFFQTVVDAVAALPEDDRIGTRAVVVLTDGPDNIGELTASDAAERIAGSGVRVVVVTFGDVRCGGGGMPTVVGASGGTCVDADPTTVAERMEEIVRRLRGGL
jgi:Mg-chelatase subunit ChlD